MIILGINAYHADSSAAIFVNGRMVAAIEEERFRRVKHWAGFPELAIAFCLEEAGIGYEGVDYYAIGRDPKAKFLKKLLYLARNPGGSFAAVKDRLSNSKKVASIDEELSRLSGLPANTFSGKIKNFTLAGICSTSTLTFLQIFCIYINYSNFNAPLNLFFLNLFFPPPAFIIKIDHYKNGNISSDVKKCMILQPKWHSLFFVKT